MTRLFTHVLVLTTLVGLALSQSRCSTDSHCTENWQHAGGKCVYFDTTLQSWRRCAASSWWCMCRTGCLLGDRFFPTEIPGNSRRMYCACADPVDNTKLKSKYWNPGNISPTVYRTSKTSLLLTADTSSSVCVGNTLIVSGEKKRLCVHSATRCDQMAPL